MLSPDGLASIDGDGSECRRRAGNHDVPDMLGDMSAETAEAVGDELAMMRAARQALAEGDGYYTSKEAANACPFDIEAETLRDYPEFVLPRTPRRPGCEQAGYLFDPRDVYALPVVLRQWHRAKENDSEDQFRKRRLREIREREERILENAGRK